MRKAYGKTAIVAAVIGLFVSSALAASPTCPSGGTPAPGSKIKALEVNGVCVLVGVTDVAGLTVEATGALSLQSSTVEGGIVVLPGGELDLNATTFGSGVPTGTTSTINGGIAVLNAADLDFWTTTVNGGIAVDGTGPDSLPTFCGNTVHGSSSFSNFANLGTIGGGITFGGVACPGNLFDGSVSLTNLTTRMGGETIKGDLLCTNSTVIVTAPNTITGKNTCY